MTLKHKNLALAVVALALAASFYASLTVATAAAASGRTEPPPAVAVSPTPPTAEEEIIQQREAKRHGITVEEPRLYDDAMLQQMLQVAEQRLKSLQTIDQSQILSRLGATSGAAQQSSGFALNVQGPSLPSVVTTSKGATGSTTSTDLITGGTTSSQGASTSTGTAGNTTQSGSGLTTGTSNTVQNVSGLATQDVVTTRGQFGPPGATAPSPTITMPSTGFSVSSSDILSEQMQLAAEINGLRMMLAGDLSGHFVRRNSNMTKLKTTLGFPITLSPDERHKDAVAVVEVEVERSTPAGKKKRRASGSTWERESPDSSGEDETETSADKSEPESFSEVPMITALLPREKTYNVASITDKSVSVGGGVATQILGVSASFLRANKTYYLVQDQDTVALAFKPENEKRAGFMWEFRPVLGRRYIKAGLKQTFVQIAFDAPRDAEEGEIGKVIVRTYWRKYDRKSGIHKEIIGRTLTRQVKFEIPSYNLAVKPPSFAYDNLEEIGDGQILVNLKGRFLPGTYVRIGSDLINTMPRLLHEHAAIRFTAPLGDLALKEVFLVAHDGTEVPLKFKGCGSDYTGKLTTTFVPVGDPSIKAVDDTKSSVTVNFAVQKKTLMGIETEKPKDTARRIMPDLVLVVGSRVFGYSELKRRWDAKMGVNELSVVVPTAILAAKPELSIQRLFPGKGCRTEPIPIADFIPPAQSARLVLLEHGTKSSRFLLSGSRLKQITVLSPEDVETEGIGGPGEAERLREINLTAQQLATHKQLLVQRPGGRPFFVTIPDVEPKKPDPPKVKGVVKVNRDTLLIDGDGMGDLEKVTFDGDEVKFDAVNARRVRLKGLRALGVTSEASTQTLLFKFKSGAEKEVEIEVNDVVAKVSR